MSLSEFDGKLLDECLSRSPRSWDDFVDRFLGLVIHVVHHTAQARSVRLSAVDQEDLVADVFLEIVKDDFALLRRFRREASLATYLTVIARRIVVHQLLKRKSATSLSDLVDPSAMDSGQVSDHPEQRLENQEEVARLLDHLEGTEADIVRLYHLEGQSYRQISNAMGVPENSIGPTLSRARKKRRRQSTV